MDHDATRRAVQAARVLLRWDPERLAKAMGVGTATLRRFEAGYPVREATMAQMLAALPGLGVVLIEDRALAGSRIVTGVGLTAAADVGSDRPMRSDAKADSPKKGMRRTPAEIARRKVEQAGSLESLLARRKAEN